jgi:Zn ribbon nucleic-acid-binding protein
MRRARRKFIWGAVYPIRVKPQDGPLVAKDEEAVALRDGVACDHGIEHGA